MTGAKSFFTKINKDTFLGTIVFSAMVLMLMFELFLPGMGAALVKKIPDLPIVNGTLHVEFPCKSDEIAFDDGWLGQSEGENYRWVRKKSVFYVGLSDQETVAMSGYIPAGINVSKAKLYVNGKKVAECHVEAEQGFTLEGSVTKQKKPGQINKFEVVFDAERVPAPDDADQRLFSGMFLEIDIL